MPSWSLFTAIPEKPQMFSIKGVSIIFTFMNVNLADHIANAAVGEFDSELS
jgi:hypothetical protein